ncbi:hypothetical protein Droror1_Dr00020055, partial [Drosera rotundifolia]
MRNSSTVIRILVPFPSRVAGNRDPGFGFVRGLAFFWLDRSCLFVARISLVVAGVCGVEIDLLRWYCGARAAASRNLNLIGVVCLARVSSNVVLSVAVGFELVSRLRIDYVLDWVSRCGLMLLFQLVLEIDNKSGEGATGSVTSVFHFHTNTLKRL